MIEITKFLQRKERIRAETTHFINSPGLPQQLSCKESACNTRDTGLIPSEEDPLEEGVATHSNTLTWRIPWTDEPDGLQSVGSQESDTTE